jgi:hypothetical protein
MPALHSLERLAAAAFIVTSDPVAGAVDVHAVSQVADWLDAAGRATAERTAPPAPPSAAPMKEDPDGSPAIPLATVLARAATSQLRTEIDHVAATAQ